MSEMKVVFIKHLLHADQYAKAIYKPNFHGTLWDRIYTHFMDDKTESYSGQSRKPVNGRTESKFRFDGLQVS